MTLLSGWILVFGIWGYLLCSPELALQALGLANETLEGISLYCDLKTKSVEED